MNRGRNLTLIIVILIFFAFGAQLVIKVAKTGETAVSKQDINSHREAEAEVDNEKYEFSPQYMIKEYYGNIGVYIKSEDEYVLISIADMDISVLPEADIEALKNGIYLESKEELQMLIEDYTS